MVKLLLEKSQLKKWNATSVERRFQLKRVIAVRDSSIIAEEFPQESESATSLNGIDVLKKLLLTYCIPFLLEKCESLTTVKENHTAVSILSLQARDKQKGALSVFYSKIKILLVRLKKILHFVFRLIRKSNTYLQWLYYLLYALGKTPYTNLADHILRQRVIYNVENIHSRKLISTREKSSLLTSIADHSMEGFLIIIQLIDWWQSNNYESHLKKGEVAFTELAPPKLPFEINVSTTDICKICGEKIKNPAVLSTGFVFCYPCIQVWLQRHPFKCPVTNLELSRKGESFWRLMI